MFLKFLIINVIQRSKAAKNLVCIHDIVFEILRFALNDNGKIIVSLSSLLKRKLWFQ